jgi:hypothetical protein
VDDAFPGIGIVADVSGCSGLVLLPLGLGQVETPLLHKGRWIDSKALELRCQLRQITCFDPLISRLQIPED